MKYTFAFVAGIFFCCLVACQTGHKSYMDIIKKRCSHPDITEVEKKEGFTEIEYLCDGKVFEIILDKNNHVIAYETESVDSVLSEQVLKKLARNYPGWQIDEYSLVYLNDTSILKVEIMKNGIEQHVYFTRSGKLYKPRSFHATQNWSSEALGSFNTAYDLKYDLANPVVTYELPEILNEISGIAILDQDNILCVQDEVGSVFQYDLKKETITRSYRFSDFGDYEDLAYHNDRVYVLRSDGTVTSFSFAGYPGDIRHEILPFQSLNIEGICYSTVDKSLFFACNETDLNVADNCKEILQLDLGGKQELKRTFSISADTVSFMLKRNFPALADYSIDFSPSAIGMHPLTGNFYLLSATDRILAICDNTGKIIALHPLPADYFYKPEGIAFFPDGDLLISSEGMKNGLVKASIQRFEYRN